MMRQGIDIRILVRNNKIIEGGACNIFMTYKNKIYTPSTSWAPYRVFNVGNSKPTKLHDYIKAIEKHLNKIEFI